MNLANELHALAERAPVRSMPPDLFDRARRRRRWRRAASGAAVLVVVLAGYVVTLPGLHRPPAVNGPAGIPAKVVAPPFWTEDVSASPPGAASLVFRGPAVPARSSSYGFNTPMAVVGLGSDVYRVLYPPQPALGLSPDGRTLLMPSFRLGSSQMRASDWRTDALDLVTGESRTLAAEFAPIGWSADGRHALLVQPDRWNTPQAPLDVINDMTVRVLAWPSGETEWSVHVARPEAVEGETNYPVALSPDGQSLVVSTSHELRLYARDGTIVWTRPLVGQDVLAGTSAWRADGRIVLVQRRTVDGWSVNGEAVLSYVDPSTGDPLPGPDLPRVQSVFSLRIVAWRGETAYAVTRTTSQQGKIEFHASLIRLSPGAAGPETILAPAGVEDLNVAADYVDVVRPAGSPSYGMSLPAVLSYGSSYTVPATIVLLIALVIWSRRRRRVERWELVTPA
jgi:hypothetical protein